MKKGIDVSQHQGLIDWKKVKEDGIEFAMLRVGYSTTLDTQFINNAKGCKDNGIPFGVYLFSYATCQVDAIYEANFLLQQIKNLKIEYPIAFDFEYDSIRYAKQMKVEMTKDLIITITKTFCDIIEKANYYCMVYTNKDYYNLYFNKLQKDYDFWLAQWKVDKPSIECGIWQYQNDGKVNGIIGKVDIDYNYKDYPELLKLKGLNKLADIPVVSVDYKVKYEKLYNEVVKLYESLN